MTLSVVHDGSTKLPVAYSVKTLANNSNFPASLNVTVFVVVVIVVVSSIVIEL